MLKVKWFGHSLWQIISDTVTIVTDPYDSIGYNMDVDIRGDIVLCSHDHHDHSNINLIKGNPQIVRSAGEFVINDTAIEMISVYHDHERGEQRGDNLLMKFTVGGKTFLHCGDLGHVIAMDLCRKIGKIDVLMIPVGEVYTLDVSEAVEVVKRLKPELILPMHYHTPVLKFKLEPVEKFVSHFDNVKSAGSQELVIVDSGNNRGNPTVVIMDYE